MCDDVGKVHETRTRWLGPCKQQHVIDVIGAKPCKDGTNTTLIAVNSFAESQQDCKLVTFANMLRLFDMFKVPYLSAWHWAVDSECAGAGQERPYRAPRLGKDFVQASSHCPNISNVTPCNVHLHILRIRSHLAFLPSYFPSLSCITRRPGRGSTLMVLARVANLFTNGESTHDLVEEGRRDVAVAMESVATSTADAAKVIAGETEEDEGRPPYLHVRNSG